MSEAAMKSPPVVLCLVGLAGLLNSFVAQEPPREVTVRWDRDAGHSDTLFYKGFEYKTIQFANISVGVSAPHYLTRGYTHANVFVLNKTEKRLDVHPEKFTCVCVDGQKARPLRYYLPKDIRLQSLLLRAHTLVAGDQIAGPVAFRGRCRKQVIQVRVSGGEATATFEFPF
jgi:hypothetical protein